MHTGGLKPVSASPFGRGVGLFEKRREMTRKEKRLMAGTVALVLVVAMIALHFAAQDGHEAAEHGGEHETMLRGDLGH